MSNDNDQIWSNALTIYDFPDDPLVKTPIPHFHCREQGFNPSYGSNMAKNKRKNVLTICKMAIKFFLHGEFR